MNLAELGHDATVARRPFNPEREATAIFDRRVDGVRLETKLRMTGSDACDASYQITRNDKSSIGVTLVGDAMRLELGLPLNLAVTCYSPRKASVLGRLLTVPGDPMREFEGRLAALAGVRPKNHVVYALRDADGSSPEPRLYVMFTDCKVHLGTEVEVAAW